MEDARALEGPGASAHRRDEAADDEETVGALAESITRRCARPLTVVAAERPAWPRELAARLSAALVVTPEELLKDPDADAWGSVILAVELASIPPGDRRALAETAWRRVANQARLVVVSSNPLAARLAPPGSPDARAVKDLVRPFGGARLMKDQPLRFVAAMVRRRDHPIDDLQPEVLRRHLVTAQLCRGRVLELGCGRGELTGLLSERGHDATGVDINRAKIEDARRFHPGARFLNGDVLQLDMESGSFDTVLLPEILEHVDEASGERMLEIAWELVAPGGRLVVTVPNEDCIPHPNHVREFTAESLLERLRPFGRAELETAQPYKWLIATVDRG